MNNLHRELAPITDAAWDQIEEEARRTVTRTIAARRVVDVIGPAGPELAAVGTGHLRDLRSSSDEVIIRQRLSQPLLELRVPFAVTRDAVDDVERGSQDSDWQPVKEAATAIGYAEDRAVFEGVEDAGIVGIAASSSNPPIPLPSDPARIPDAVAQAVSSLRLAGVNGPYSLLLSAEVYTAVAESSDHGYPILDHLTRLLRDGEIIWAPAMTGALLVTTRGGDYALHLGQDLSIGYQSHDANHIQLYLQESLTFLPYTSEAGVALPTS
ncbi:family 1 encapsulin nanocompartment shell protein [Microlunatus soli]|uniref:Type 1 encapsulin shell protein n=1 Tax=Microlunatus soli TaxID=630515 RepID=A0A1H2AGZ4_9ACTN|nr:family 1 encapsulin nanocompartment shell protein [Microlunatus soli]SDT45184.1 Uncharacterized protein, linocin/CFP29 family [Microlunatus soli]